MDHVNVNNGSKEITYSLTFLQRFFNPLAMLVYRALQSVGAVLILYVFLVEDLFDIFDIAVPWFFTWMVVVIAWRLLFLRGSLFLQNRKAARCIVLAFEPKAIGFGRKKIEYWVQYKKAKIHRGLFGTNQIYTDFYGAKHIFVVPESAISLSKLRELVEVDKDV